MPPASPTLAAGKPDRAGPGHIPALPGGPGRPVYVLHASDRAVLMGEDKPHRPLQHLVTTILAAGATHPAGRFGHALSCRRPRIATSACLLAGSGGRCG